MSRGLPHSLKHLATRRASPEARTLVLNIIKQNGALTVQDLYKHTQREQAPTQEGSSHDEDFGGIIPSMRYVAGISDSSRRTERLMGMPHRQVPEEGRAPGPPAARRTQQGTRKRDAL